MHCGIAASGEVVGGDETAEIGYVAAGFPGHIPVEMVCLFMKIVNANFLYYEMGMERRGFPGLRKNMLVLKKIRVGLAGVNLAIIFIIENYADPR